jgi:hypothetical protein
MFGFTTPLKRVVVHTKDGKSLEAVLAPRSPKGHYLLSAVRLRESEDRTVPLSFGDVLVPRENVSLIEVSV